MSSDGHLNGSLKAEADAELRANGGLNGTSNGHINGNGKSNGSANAPSYPPPPPPPPGQSQTTLSNESSTTVTDAMADNAGHIDNGHVNGNNHNESGSKTVNGTRVVKKRILRKKVKPPVPILKYIWLGGHSATIFFGLLSLCYMCTFSSHIIGKIAYRLAFISSIMTLSSSAINKFGFAFPNGYTLLASENFQYLLLGVTWLVTYKSVFKILPYFLISSLQIATYFDVDAVLKEGDMFGMIIAYNELALIVVLFVRTLLFRTTSGFQLVLFGIFYWIRILFSQQTQNLFQLLIFKLDNKIPRSNPKVVHIWEKTKLALEQKRKQNGFED